MVVIFEETVPKYLDQAKAIGFDLEEMVGRGLLEVVYVRPLDLSMDETFTRFNPPSTGCPPGA